MHLIAREGGKYSLILAQEKEELVWEHLTSLIHAPSTLSSLYFQILYALAFFLTHWLFLLSLLCLSHLFPQTSEYPMA